MKSLARLHVWWPTLDTDIEQTVRQCHACQDMQAKPAQATGNPWIWPSRTWQRIHVDFAGPFIGGMFIIVIDAHSKWLEVMKMSSTTAESTINALRYLFSMYGLPEELVSDNGPQFVAQEFETFLSSNGVKHVRSAPYHPSSNGEAERAVRTFKQGMKTVKNAPGNLNQKLSSFLLSYHTPQYHMTHTC
jgi:transposase InsO family protein